MDTLENLLIASIDQIARRKAEATITAADRCDRCGAQTIYRMFRSVLHGERPGVLEFCGHHYRANREALADDGWEAVAGYDD